MTVADQLSFLPDDYKHRRIRRRTLVVGTTATLVVIAAVVCTGLIAQRSLKQVEQEHALVSLTYSYATQQIARIRHERDEQRAVLRRAALAASLTDGVPQSNILAELTNALPGKTSLIELHVESHPHAEPLAGNGSVFDMKKAALEARNRDDALGTPDMPAQDVTLKLSGLADTDVQVAQYLKQLSQSALFRDVNLLISENQAVPGSAGVTVRRFQMQMSVNMGARLKPALVVPETATAGVDVKIDR